jgi:hypothetical protein
VQIVDLGPCEASGHQRAEVRSPDGASCTLVYMAWPGNLIVFEAACAAGAAEGFEARAVLALHARLEEGAPTRFTHYAVQQHGVLLAYAGSALAPGLVVSGIYGDRGLSFDPLSCVDLARVPEQVSEDHPAIDVILTFTPTLLAWGLVPQPGRAELLTWLEDPDESHRVALIRRLGRDAGVPPEAVAFGHLVAMLNETYTVRQYAAMQLSGFSAGVTLQADLGALLAHLADPGAILGGLAAPDHPWRGAQSRRNARYAVLWTLGNIAWTATGGTAAPWLGSITREARALLRDQLVHRPPDREAWLADLVAAEFVDHPERRYAVGVAEPIDLFDLLRFAVLRWRAVEQLGLQATDRFYWLVQSVEALLGTAEEEPAVEVVAAVFASPPALDLPADLKVMPEWCFGENHLGVPPG